MCFFQLHRYARERRRRAREVLGMILAYSKVFMALLKLVDIMEDGYNNLWGGSGQE